MIVVGVIVLLLRAMFTFSELIKSEITKREQALKLLEIVKKRGPTAYRSLINALRHDYDYLATLLERTSVSNEEVEKTRSLPSSRVSTPTPVDIDGSVASVHFSVLFFLSLNCFQFCDAISIL